MSAPTSRRGVVARWALNIYAALGMVYLFVPIAWIVIFSFNRPKGNYNIIWQEFTFENWADPTEFINKYRRLNREWGKQAVPVGTFREYNGFRGL